jgi:DNA (cytosine-5)-methyltransferase 1
MKLPFTFMDYCAGIWAGRLWLEKNGMKCIWFSEINKQSEKTYRLFYWEEERNYWDLMKIDTNILPDFWLMIAGFPCQTFSVIGKRMGMEDERWQIIYGLIHILKEKNIPFFILENVKWLVNHNWWQTINKILTDLKDAWYRVEYKVLSSMYYGVPQMRERVYFVWIRNDIHSGQYVYPDTWDVVNIHDYLIDDTELSPYEKKTTFDTFQKYLQNTYNKWKYTIENLLKNEYSIIDTRQSDLRVYKDKIPTLRTWRHGILYVKNGKFRKLSWYESLLLQWFPKDIAIKAKWKISDTHLLWQSWNAMTVSTIYHIAKNLLPHINYYENKRPYSTMIENSKSMISEWGWHSKEIFGLENGSRYTGLAPHYAI